MLGPFQTPVEAMERAVAENNALLGLRSEI
jgi:hypothetical protein